MLDDYSLAHVGEVDQVVLDRFTCGDEDLDAFLKSEAKSYADAGITSTTVIFLNGDPAPMGFFSLSADSINLSSMEEFELGIAFQLPVPFFPAVKITKLAVRSGEQSKGIGEQMVKLIQGIAYSSPVSARLLTVNAVNRPRAIAFYERCNFIRSHRNDVQRQGRRPANEPETVLFYKDLYTDD
ncbi:GNAT family N-acetyltransferase [Pseudomonas syringae]|nr:GNAT family N-acetyltransferase [Pseudomonas syringae]